MSGGRQQRVAIGVLLANAPAVPLADEPTGELGSLTAAQIFEAFRTANKTLGATIAQAVASEVRRAVAIRDGRTSSEVLRRSGIDAATGHETVAARGTRCSTAPAASSSPPTTSAPRAMRDRMALELESDHIGVWPDVSR